MRMCSGLLIPISYDSRSLAKGTLVVSPKMAESSGYSRSDLRLQHLAWLPNRTVYRRSLGICVEGARAVVEGASISQDGRWEAESSRKRMVHIFAVNPCGGKVDHKSHLDGKVRNVPKIVIIFTLQYEPMH